MGWEEADGEAGEERRGKGHGVGCGFSFGRCEKRGLWMYVFSFFFFQPVSVFAFCLLSFFSFLDGM